MPHNHAPYGYPQVGVQSYTPFGARREFTPDEQAAIEAGESRWLPKIFQSYGTPIPEMMASPGKTSLLRGLAGGTIGAGMGGVLGSSLGGPYGAVAGATLGGLGLGGLSAALGYHGQKAQNEGLEDIMRRLPPGATKRDYLSDSVVQKEMDRALQYDQMENQAAMQRALVRAMLMKHSHEKRADEFPGGLNAFHNPTHPDVTATPAPELPHAEGAPFPFQHVLPETASLLGLPNEHAPGPVQPHAAAPAEPGWAEWTWNNKVPLGLGALGAYGLYRYLSQPDEDERHPRLKSAGLGQLAGRVFGAGRQFANRHPLATTVATLPAATYAASVAARTGHQLGNAAMGENLNARTPAIPNMGQAPKPQTPAPEPPPAGTGRGFLGDLDSSLEAYVPGYDKLKGYGQQAWDFAKAHRYEVGGGALGALALGTLAHHYLSRDEDEDALPYKRASAPMADLVAEYPAQVGFLAGCYDKGLTPRAIAVAVEKAASASEEAGQAWRAFFRAAGGELKTAASIDGQSPLQPLKTVNQAQPVSWRMPMAQRASLIGPTASTPGEAWRNSMAVQREQGLMSLGAPAPVASPRPMSAFEAGARLPQIKPALPANYQHAPSVAARPTYVEPQTGKPFVPGRADGDIEGALQNRLPMTRPVTQQEYSARQHQQGQAMQQFWQAAPFVAGAALLPFAPALLPSGPLLGGGAAAGGAAGAGAAAGGTATGGAVTGGAATGAGLGAGTGAGVGAGAAGAGATSTGAAATGAGTAAAGAGVGAGVAGGSRLARGLGTAALVGDALYVGPKVVDWTEHQFGAGSADQPGALYKADVEKFNTPEMYAKLQQMTPQQKQQMLAPVIQQHVPYMAEQLGMKPEDLTKQLMANGTLGDLDDARVLGLLQDKPIAEAAAATAAKTGESPLAALQQMWGGMSGGQQLLAAIGLPLGVIGLLHGAFGGGGLLSMILGALGLGAAAHGMGAFNGLMGGGQPAAPAGGNAGEGALALARRAFKGGDNEALAQMMRQHSPFGWFGEQAAKWRPDWVRRNARDYAIDDIFGPAAAGAG